MTTRAAKDRLRGRVARRKVEYVRPFFGQTNSSFRVCPQTNGLLGRSPNGRITASGSFWASRLDGRNMIGNGWKRTSPNRIRFGVGGLMALVPALGAGLGWLVHHARTQRAAVAAITAAGGTVHYRNQLGAGQLVLGREYFGCVVGVTLRDKASDTLLAHVGHLNHLEHLILNGSPITDVGLEKLQSLTALTQLQLDGTQITDAGLVHLRALSELRWLSLVNTKVSDSGLPLLARQVSIESLQLPVGISEKSLHELEQAMPNASIRRGFPLRYYHSTRPSPAGDSAPE